MSNEAQFHTPGETIAAVEDALSFLAHSVVSRGSGKEQLEFIARARKASGRFVSLIAVWAAEADRAGVARTAARTTVADWLTRTGNADPGEAIGLIRDGQTLLGSPTLKDAATSGTLTPRQLGGIKKTMRELPDDLTRAQRQEAEQQLLEQARTMTPSELGRQAKDLAAQFAPPSVSDAEAEARELEAQRKRAVSRRFLTLTDDGDGSLLIDGSLPYLEGEKLRRFVAGYVGLLKVWLTPRPHGLWEEVVLKGWQSWAKITYTDEFKRDAVALVASGISQKQVAKDLGMAKTTVQAWVRGARFQSHGMTPTTDPEARKDMSQALRRIRELEMENEVLRRAAAYLSQAHITPPK